MDNNDKINNEGTIPNLNKPDDDTIEKALNQIRLRCPVKKVNFDVENKFGVIGMWLVCQEKPQTILKPDLEGLNNDTILFFANSHISEVIQILYSAFNILRAQHILLEDEPDMMIERLLIATERARKWSSFKTHLENVSQTHLFNKNINMHLAKNIEYIITYIWFTPYNVVDDIYRTAIEYYKNRFNKGDEEK